ncbi:MAG: hypothetical protein J6K32_12930 [Clostridia bacterium]|nr:hypothetical protein [Clostridia bacterium]
MARITVNNGAEEIARLLEEMSRSGEAVAKMATYEAARVVADAVREAVETLPEDKYRYLRDGDLLDVITKDDKEDLLDAIGIAEMKRSEDGVDTLVGFAGYSRHKTKKYPQGVPLPMIMRSIEHGSSVRQARPTIKPAVYAVRAEAKAAAIKGGRRAIEQIIKEGH